MHRRLVTERDAVAPRIVSCPAWPGVAIYESPVGGPIATRPRPGTEPGRRGRSVVVSYQVRPEAVAEHVHLIESVFAQLHAEQPGNVEYKVVRLADEVSFVHVSSADTPDGSNPLPELASF